MPRPRAGRRADFGRPVEDYVGFLRARGKLTQAQFAAACVLRELATPPAQAPKRTLLDCGRHGGDITAARIAARRQFIRVMAALQTESQGVILQVVVQNRSLTEIEPSASRRRRCVKALRAALDLMAQALPLEHPAARRRSER